MKRFALVIACLALACGKHAATTPGSGITIRVPGALRVARGLDTLSVAIDPASRGETSVNADPRLVLGVEAVTRLFAIGDPRVRGERHGLASGTDFDIGTSTWNTRQDGSPEPDKKYVVEMTFVLFETDVRPGHEWDPHAGRYQALLTRTIRQPEE